MEDLTTEHFTNDVMIRQNNGDGTFTDPEPLYQPSGTYPYSLSAADFNGDGRPDLAVFNFPVNLFDLLFASTFDINQIDLIGQTIAAFPSATAAILLNTSASESFTNANAASFVAGALAPGSIVSAFGTALAASIASAASLPLPTSLAGTSITVRDAAGTSRPASLFYVSPTQINYAIPDQTAIGEATFTIQTAANSISVQQTIVPVSPGIFAASGIAAGNVMTYSASPVPALGFTISVAADGSLIPTPIDVGSASSQVYLLLYATGLRNHSSAAVTATIGSANVPVAVDVVLHVDGATTNPVKINLQ